MANQATDFKGKAGRFGRRALLIFGLLLVIGGLAYYFIRTYSVSDGTRTGVLYKISRKGVVFKTYEGELQLGSSQFLTEQSIWRFSVKNAAVYEKLQQFEGKSVKLHYRELVNPFPWQGDTKYLVYQADPVQ